ncbi:MAG: hypothetical protein ACJASR_000146 [Psychroserpens sp.]|jgi:hypothetical protein
MQQIVLRRFLLSNKAFIGKLYLDKQCIAVTLENPWLDNEPFISCIPKGDYEVNKYSSKKYPNVWELQNVDGRSKILIHNGNKEKHTQGCILVGDKWGNLSDELAVLNSKKTLNKLRSILDDDFLLKII